jgi:uncharacterized protein YbjT (DUF2867 family)
MRIAVVGGTGLVGRHVTSLLHERGDEVVVVSRSCGVDVFSGAGLDQALTGVAAVIDVTSTPEIDPALTRKFCGTVTERLLGAEQRAAVAHHVVLSIVNVDRVPTNGHYAGKRRQEELVEAGPIPATVLRATQFHEFAGVVVGWTLRGRAATVPPLLIQPVAARDVAKTLAEIVAGPPQGRARDLAGPEPHDLVDMARRTLAAAGSDIRLEPSWHVEPFSPEMAGDVLLPGPHTRIAETTFDRWLTLQRGQPTPF